jgi:hypothetical protein
MKAYYLAANEALSAMISASLLKELREFEECKVIDFGDLNLENKAHLRSKRGGRSAFALPHYRAKAHILRF